MGGTGTKAAVAKDVRVVTVTVRGMVSRHDVRTISASLADVAGVVTVQVDLPSATVQVEGAVTSDEVRAAVTSVGYEIS